MSDQAGNDVDRDPTTQRDFSKPWNQLRPLPLRSSGTELDECCGEISESSASTLADSSSIPLAAAGRSLDAGLRKQPAKYGKL